MRRREFAIGLVLAAAATTVRAEEPAKQHRIAIVIPAFFDEPRRLRHVEGQNNRVRAWTGPP